MGKPISQIVVPMGRWCMVPPWAGAKGAFPWVLVMVVTVVANPALDADAIQQIKDRASTDIALGKPVTTSSIAHGSAASNLVNGANNNAAWNPSKCVHTNKQASWIKVDLKSTVNIEKI